MRLTFFYAMVLAGFAAAVLISVPRVRRLGFSNRQILKFAVIGLAVDLIGARLAWFIQQRPNLSGHWLDLLKLSSGGASALTVLAPGVLVISWLLKRQGRPVLPVVAAILPALVLAMAIVRVGCFVNGCCYGLFTTVPWAICSPGEARGRHPTQLYELLFLLGLFFLLLRMEKSSAGPARRVWTAAAGYAAFRFLNDFFRIDHLFPFAWGLTVNQWIALTVLMICGAIALKKRVIGCTRSCSG